MVFEHRQEEKSDIFLANIGSEEAIKLELGPGFHREPSIDYRGRNIVFSSETDSSKGEIYLADLDKMKLINLSNHPDADFQPSIDDNGEKVVFTSERNKKSEIYLVQLKKSKPEKLINFSNDKKSWYYFPQISGNGKNVVYAKEDARQSIWVKETENPYASKPLEEDHNYWYMDPQISRDGTRIAWTRVKKQESSNKKKIFLADIVTGDKFEISNGENSERPSISANGEYIAWLEGSAIIGNYEIKVQDTKTGKIEKLGKSLSSELLKNEYLSRDGVNSTTHFFRISPDGKFLGIFLPHESGAIYGIGNPHKEPGLMYTVDEKIRDPKKKESLYGDDK
ncbi:PD40 domain-containing protein [Candidatus Pacearchaeota archaeon]|nr:PD40 domain-containing protein [Candidatus Pacearchaeota archaeon]